VGIVFDKLNVFLKGLKKLIGIFFDELNSLV